MKFNVTYSQKTDLFKTLKDIETIKDKLIKKICTIRNFTKVTAPLFYEESDLKIIDMSSKTRHITFDFGAEYKVGTIALTHTNWIRDLIQRANVPEGEGIFVDSSYIWRDGDNDPSSAPTKDELTFQYRIKEEDANAEARNIVQDIYEYMYDINVDFKKTYNIRNAWPEFAKYISSQSMANEMPGETFRQREIDTVLENIAFIFESPGSKMFSGKKHSLLPPALYDLKNFYQIVLKDSVNSNVLKVASVSVLASGQTLIDQLHLNDLSNLLSNEFYSKLSQQQDKIMEIKINIPRLAMSILSKGHIGETQAGVISNEAEVIKERNKINII